MDTYGTTRVNRFCAVVRDVREPKSVTSEGNQQSLLVYWPVGKTIYTYGPSASGPISLLNQDAGATIDLTSDVVATSDDLKGSASRITLASVKTIIRHCRVSGTRLTLIRRGGRQ